MLDLASETRALGWEKGNKHCLERSHMNALPPPPTWSLGYVPVSSCLFVYTSMTILFRHEYEQRKYLTGGVSWCYSRRLVSLLSSIKRKLAKSQLAMRKSGAKECLFFHSHSFARILSINNKENKDRIDHRHARRPKKKGFFPLGSKWWKFYQAIRQFAKLCLHYRYLSIPHSL